MGKNLSSVQKFNLLATSTSTTIASFHHICKGIDMHCDEVTNPNPNPNPISPYF